MGSFVKEGLLEFPDVFVLVGGTFERAGLVLILILVGVVLEGRLLAACRAPVDALHVLEFIAQYGPLHLNYYL